METSLLHRIITSFIAAVWFVNGLICKVLNLVPRHHQIVGQLLGNEFARPVTTTIGIAEILMSVWILSGLFRKFNVILQIVIVLMMNVIEFIVVPDLLLFGRLNLLFAFLFCCLIYYNEFVLRKRLIAEGGV